MGIWIDGNRVCWYCGTVRWRSSVVVVVIVVIVSGGGVHRCRSSARRSAEPPTAHARSWFGAPREKKLCGIASATCMGLNGRGCMRTTTRRFTLAVFRPIVISSSSLPPSLAQHLPESPDELPSNLFLLPDASSSHTSPRRAPKHLDQTTAQSPSGGRPAGP